MTWLAETVRSEGGRVTFERFMEFALYHPVHGYYTEHVSDIGRSGDFSTAMTIGDSLVRSVASWLKAEAKQLSMPVTQVIELGGGTGQLASGILRSFMPWQRIRYQIVEVSKMLRQVQERELRGKHVQWKDSVEAALQAAKGEAILISNEFVDAFPCQRFERGAHGWKEISLTLEGDLWREESSESLALPASSVFAVDYATGQRVETLQSYRKLADQSGSLSSPGRDSHDRLRRIAGSNLSSQTRWNDAGLFSSPANRRNGDLFAPRPSGSHRGRQFRRSEEMG